MSERLGLNNFVLHAQREATFFDESDPVAAISRFETRMYLGHMLLRDGDANSMAHGLEVRVPLLDKRMLDLMHRLPGDVRLPSLVADKHLLRKAFPDLLRPALARQAKRGFTLPLQRWLLCPLRDLAEHALANLKGSGLVRQDGVSRIWQAFLRDPESPIWSRAWTLVASAVISTALVSIARTALHFERSRG